MSFPGARPARSLLDKHRLLSPTASVRVSPLCLGAMNFGDAHAHRMGECKKETAFAIMDYFYSQGGNFIDTANGYQDGESEQWVGSWMAARGNRDEIVLATKYSSSYRNHEKEKTQSNFGGNLPELMHSLNDLVSSGKVMYLGISDTPAWIVSKCNQYARDHGLRQFVVYQGLWNAAIRDFERDIIPMCHDEGMGILPYGTLGQGRFQSEEGFKARDKTDHEGRKGKPPTAEEKAVSKVLEKIATAKKTTITSVALRYVMYKAPYVFPLIGGRKVEHLKDNIAALGLKLSPEELGEIDTAYNFDHGFPHTFLSGTLFFGGQPRGPAGPGDVWLTKAMGNFDWVEGEKPIDS